MTLRPLLAAYPGSGFCLHRQWDLSSTPPTIAAPSVDQPSRCTQLSAVSPAMMASTAQACLPITASPSQGTLAPCLLHHSHPAIVQESGVGPVFLSLHFRTAKLPFGSIHCISVQPTCHSLCTQL